jgi:nitric oxide dioxygenase
MVAEPVTELEAASSSENAGERLLVEFELDGEGYGVNIADIREIIRCQTVTVVPGTPEVVEGIINLRGRITPIVDRRKRVGLHPSEVDDASRVIVIEVDDALVGVHVDAVTEVVSITDDQLQQLSSEVTTDRSSYLEGVADIDGRLIILINLQRALEGGAATMAPPRERIRAATEEDAPEEADDGEGLPLKIGLLEQSFEAVKPRAEELVALFYDKRFEQHTAVQPLFADSDMNEQQGKLLSALATVVASLRQPDVLVPHLQELGRRHVACGAEPEHYEAVGGVLLESLGEIAGELWTDDLRDAWTEAVTLVATVMIEAAAEVEPETAPDEALGVDDDAGLPLKIEMLEGSFEALKPHAEALVALFYDKLFEQHPAVQLLFANTDMNEQQGKLVSALATVVASLRQPDVLVPHLQELGRRHVEYGAEPAHYEAVGAVLLESMGEIAGELLWTDELREAWTEAVTLVATVMIEAAAEVGVEAASVEAMAEAAKPKAKRKPAAKKRAAAKKKPAAKKPAAKKPAAKMPAAEKAAVKKKKA